jgi:hypothetical protein
MQPTRRGFLSALLGFSVVAVLPKMALDAVAAPSIDPFKIVAPDGTTYQWVRTALLGVPDPENLQARLDNGWTFVAPAEHPGAPSSTLGHAIEETGLILMQKPTAEVVAYQAKERADREACLADRGLHKGKVVIGEGDMKLFGTVTQGAEIA